MNVVRFLVVAVLSGLGLAGIAAAPASACSCAADSLRDDLSATDVVFVGTLTDRSQDGDDMSGTIVYTFDVDEVYQGRAVTPVEVTTTVQDTACGLTGLVVDKKYVVFAGGEGDELGTSSCSRTDEVRPGLIGRIAEITGAPGDPVPAPPDDGVPVLAIAAGASGALLLAIFLVIRGARGSH